MLGFMFEDFYMCVTLIFKDKLQDNYSNLNELYPNYQFQVTKKTAKGSVLEGLRKMSKN